MARGFYVILIAQFLSALADNALLFAAIALLSQLHSPSWHTPLLQEFFVTVTRKVVSPVRLARRAQSPFLRPRSSASTGSAAFGRIDGLQVACHQT